MNYYISDLHIGNGTGYGTPNGNFINVGAMMPYMDYTPRTLEEIISGDKAYRQTNDYLSSYLDSKKAISEL